MQGLWGSFGFFTLLQVSSFSALSFWTSFLHSNDLETWLLSTYFPLSNEMAIGHARQNLSNIRDWRAESLTRNGGQQSQVLACCAISKHLSSHDATVRFGALANVPWTLDLLLRLSANEQQCNKTSAYWADSLLGNPPKCLNRCLARPICLIEALPPTRVCSPKPCVEEQFVGAVRLGLDKSALTWP